MQYYIFKLFALSTVSSRYFSGRSNKKVIMLLQSVNIVLSSAEVRQAEEKRTAYIKGSVVDLATPHGILGTLVRSYSSV